MPGTPTPILGLTVPTVGSDADVWGNELNTDLAIIDSLGTHGVSSSAVGRTLAYGISAIQLCFETAGAGGITDVLPTAVGHLGQGFLIKKVDSAAGAVTINTTSSQTIDSAVAPYSLTNQNQYVLVVSDNANWQIIANN
jgi:hypothetical protein